MGLARAEYVKAARKDNPVAKKGESYWHWSHFRGLKQYSKEQPRNSQLESNEDLSEVYAIQEEIEDCTAAEVADAMQAEERQNDWASRLNDVASNVRDKFDNLPEGFQQGDTGQQLEERADNIEECANHLEGVDTDGFQTDDKDDEPNEFDFDGWRDECLAAPWP